jgi:predicted dehydrogenase
MYTIGVVGCRRISKNHFETIQQLQKEGKAALGNINVNILTYPKNLEGRKTVEIIEAAYQSALSGGQVRMCAMPR